MNDVIADAMYIEDTNGGRQKVLYADGEVINLKRISQRRINNMTTRQLEKGVNSDVA
jgi:hypothetical protein